MSVTINGTSGVSQDTQIVGVNTTPSNWGNPYSYSGFQMGIAALWGLPASQWTNLATNYYFDNTGDKYMIDGYGYMYSQTNGTHRWQIAPSGTAGSALTFTEIMRTQPTGGLSIGATNSPGAGGLVVAGNLYLKAPAPASKSAAATLTAAEITGGMIQYTGAAAALTFPTGTSLDGTLNLVVDQGIDFYVINTGTGAATMTANTGVTIVGAAAVAAGSSGHFRLRYTAAATYVAYRLS